MQAVGGSMGQKVEAMKQGAQQLREVDQICQSILDAGPAAAGTDCDQHMQKGGQLASKCNGWANEAQVLQCNICMYSLPWSKFLNSMNNSDAGHTTM